ncbi:MAG: BatD family protein, partial [Myxococcota bacterium]
MRTVFAGCIGILATLGMVSGAWAEDIRWNLSGPVGVGQRAILELVFEGARPRGDVELPPVDGLTVLGVPSISRSTQMSYSSGQGAELRSTVTLGFPIRTDRQGTLTIPRFEVETDEGTVEVPGVSIVVAEPRMAEEGNAAGVRFDDIATAKLQSSRRDPYAGEVIDLDLVVSVAPGRRGELMGSPLWNEADAIAEPWSEGRAVRVGRRSGMHFETRAVVEAAGPTILEPVEQEIAIETGKKRDPFGGAFGRMNSLFGSSGPSIFGRPEMARFLVSSDPLSLDVAPLPGPAPEGFLGAVGDFRLESKIVPQHPKAGEPLTWTLSLE